MMSRSPPLEIMMKKRIKVFSRDGANRVLLMIHERLEEKFGHSITADIDEIKQYFDSDQVYEEYKLLRTAIGESHNVIEPERRTKGRNNFRRTR